MKTRHRRRKATPVAHMILSRRMADHKPHDMICELVDNALDADAEHVWIELGRRGITVADDGSGMEDINDAIRFGRGTRAGRRGGVLGRYGVGMTDALCKLGPRAEVTTLRDRFVEETTELVKGLSTAHLQIFLGAEWQVCLGTHKNRLERGRDALFEDIRSRAKDWLDAAARQAEALPHESE